MDVISGNSEADMSARGMSQADRGARRLRRRRAISAWSGLLAWAGLAAGAIAIVPLLNLVKVAGFPLGYWTAAQGGLMLLLLIVALLVWWEARAERREGGDAPVAGGDGAHE
jgi:putative solute:sodium symporter small subunit